MDLNAQSLAILDRLVAFPTLPGQANIPINDYVADRLSACGARVRRMTSQPDDVEGLIISIGPDVPGGIILSGHSDVVAVDGQDWSGDPFQLRRDGTRLYGRGTTDMKGFVACVIALLEHASDQDLSVPVHLFLSGDEETTCQSVQSLIAHAKTHLPPVRGVVIGEATLMHPVDRHKASATHLVEITGHSMHASLAHKGVSATAIAARLIVWLEQETARNAGAASDGGFDPNYTTHTVGMLSGGIASNTVAENCTFTWDVRLMPNEVMADVLGRFDSFASDLINKARIIAPAAGFSHTCDAIFPGLDALKDGPFRDEVLRVTGRDALGAVPYGTEAGFFQGAGMDTIIMGPGDIAQAHKPNEYIEHEQLEACLRLIRHLFV